MKRIMLKYLALILMSMILFSQVSAAAEENTISEEPTIADLLPTMEEKLVSMDGDWSFYICNLQTGEEGTVSCEKRQAASLIKLYIMGTVYENYEKIAEKHDTQDIDMQLYNMITVSDNDASNTLVSWLGETLDPAEIEAEDTSMVDDSTGQQSAAGMRMVNDFCEAHGFAATHMGRLLLHSNALDDNYTSVEDCGYILKAIYHNNTEEFPCAENMFALLKDQQRTHKIPALLPEGVHTANKTGELDDVENDAAILFDIERDLVIVFMSENLPDCYAAQQGIAQMSRDIYEFIK